MKKLNRRKKNFSSTQYSKRDNNEVHNGGRRITSSWLTGESDKNASLVNDLTIFQTRSLVVNWLLLLL